MYAAPRIFTMTHCCIVLIGPPGSGKGTQAARISERYGVPSISTGDTLRAAGREDTPLGRHAKTVMAAGGLVGDDLMIDLMRARLAEDDAARGFVLDGFPRTLVQAEALDRMAGSRALLTLVLSVPDAELTRRLSARRVCPRCKKLYTSGTHYGSEEEHCSRCGISLIRRDDDNPGTIERRLLTYHAVVGPLVEHYRRRSTTATLDGSQPADDVWAGIVRHIDTMRARGDGPPAVNEKLQVG
jgi:adenylate kinase